MPSDTALSVDSSYPRRYSRKMVESDEKAMLERIRAGDDASFEVLVKQHAGAVIGLAWRLIGHRDDAEDLAQEAFLRLHRSLPDFRGDSRISTWLYRTTSRLAIDYLRREQLKRKLFFFRQTEDDQDPVELATDRRDNPGLEVQSREAIKQLREAMTKLSPRQQVVFTLRHQDGLPLQEIAAHLGMETGTVKSHLHRAVTLLRKELADYYEELP